MSGSIHQFISLAETGPQVRRQATHHTHAFPDPDIAFSQRMYQSLSLPANRYSDWRAYEGWQTASEASRWLTLCNGELPTTADQAGWQSSRSC